MEHQEESPGAGDGPRDGQEYPSSPGGDNYWGHPPLHRSLCPAPDGGPGAGDGLSFIGLLAPQPAYEVAKGNPSPGKQNAILFRCMRQIGVAIDATEARIVPGAP